MKRTDNGSREIEVGAEQHEEPRFMHQRLDVYELSLQLAEGAAKVAKAIPRGNRRIVDQLKRSSTAVPLLIAEAANRRSRAQKRQRFEEALGETGECAAAVEIAGRLELVDEELTERPLQLAWQIAKILAKLEKNHR